METLITEAALAKLFNKSIRAMKELRYNKVGPPYIRLGSSIRYSPSEVEKWIKKKTNCK